MAEKKYDVPVTTTQTGDRGIPSLDSQLAAESTVPGIDNAFGPLAAEKKYDVPVSTTQTGDRGISSEINYASGSIEAALDYIENQVTNPGGFPHTQAFPQYSPATGLDQIQAVDGASPAFPDFQPDQQPTQGLNLDYGQNPSKQE